MARILTLILALLTTSMVCADAAKAKRTTASAAARKTMTSLAAKPSSYHQGIEVCSTCAKGATLTCCQATFAGDLFSVQWLAELTNYPLEPKDVNCIGGRVDQYSSPEKCVGVKTCCDVVISSDANTGLGDLLGLDLLKAPVLGLYCQGINQTCSTEYSHSGTSC